VRGAQQALPTQRALPEHSQGTEPQALVKVVLHWFSQLGSAQHWSLTQVNPPPQPNVRSPQALLTVPQKVALGRVGSSQQVPAPPSVLPHARPLPHEPALHVRSPQLLLRTVLQAAPSPPQVGSVQHAPMVWPVAFLQI
jgi:hypothetical protein